MIVAGTILVFLALNLTGEVYKFGDLQLTVLLFATYDTPVSSTLVGRVPLIAGCSDRIRTAVYNIVAVHYETIFQ